MELAELGKVGELRNTPWVPQAASAAREWYRIEGISSQRDFRRNNYGEKAGDKQAGSLSTR